MKTCRRLLPAVPYVLCARQHSALCKHHDPTQYCTSVPRSLSTKSVQELVNSHTRLMNNKPNVNTPKLDPNGVFTNTELRLSDMEVIGFDYDYTLAPYTKTLHQTIFDRIIEGLISRRHYPAALKDLKYNHNFLSRGVHYDINTGVFMKIDAYHRIQMDSVHHRFRLMPEEETVEQYPGKRIFFGQPGSAMSQNFKQIVDIFQIPQLYAWAAVLDYLEGRNSSTRVQPFIVYEDIANITNDLHISGRLHEEIASSISDYLEPNPKLYEMLAMLREQDKKLFVLTNSPYNFVDIGMKHMIGSDWKDLFDVIICMSRKPKFFEHKHQARVFRRLSSHNIPTFGEVTSLKKGAVYSEGNVTDLHRMTGWKPHNILYFGDQMYADLAEPVLTQGWHTGAIIRELSPEIGCINSYKYQEQLYILSELNYLINNMQLHLPEPAAVEYTDNWCAQRKQVRAGLKAMLDGNFGSIFRTHLTPTLFHRRLSRFAEIYTADIINLAHYNPAHYRFMPIRTRLPHEISYESKQWDV